MPRESKKARRERAAEVFELLTREYPEAHCELNFVDAFQLAVATILSAQTTDERVNMVTPGLFERYPDAPSLASARQEDVEEVQTDDVPQEGNEDGGSSEEEDEDDDGGGCGCVLLP